MTYCYIMKSDLKSEGVLSTRCETAGKYERERMYIVYVHLKSNKTNGYINTIHLKLVF